MAEHGDVTSKRRRTFEILLWLLVALLFSGRFLIAVMTSSKPLIRIVTEHYSYILIAVFLATIPFLFELTFGLLPFESLRQRAQNARAPSEAPPDHEVMAREQMTQDGTPAAEQLMRIYAERSDRIARGLYKRAGVYLIAGTIIAFMGLVVFSLQTNALQEQALERLKVEAARPASATPVQRESAGAVLLSRAAELTPRFGILFFIEIVAFFFLRQYRSAMDEFRYFEAVKRNREEMRAVLLLARQSGVSIDLGKLVESGRFFSTSGKLSAGETTELIETRKLSRDELIVFEQIIAALSPGKKPA